MTATRTVPTHTTVPTRPETPKLVTGDRCCTRCGYNLIGQQVFREEHYSMLIVRCPECGTVASVQEYPLLGGWAVRWGVVLAVLWCLLLVSLWPGTAGIMCGMSLAIGDEAASSYTMHLEELYAASRPQAAGTAAPAQTRIVQIPGGTRIQFGPSVGGDFAKWWAQQDRPALLAAAGGWRNAINGDAFLLLVPACLLLFAAGWLWSVFLIQLKRRWLIVCAAAIVALACVMLAVGMSELHLQPAGWARTAARQQLALPAVAIGIAFCTAALGLGMRYGRPLTRLIVRVFLPPRLRSSLTLLWTTEGLKPPA
jgi:hypothetical protein